MEKKNLYVLDLDGTLVEDGKHLSRQTVSLLNSALEDRSKELIISSARNYLSIKRRLSGLNRDIKIISRNGSVIYNENGNVIYKALIEKGNVIKAINYAMEQNLCPVVIKIIDNDEVLYCNSKYINNEFNKHAENIHIEYVQDLESINLQNVVGIYAFGKTTKAYNLPNLKIRKDKDFLQISGMEADKGKALEFIKNTEKYNSITCFGNDENDYPMLDLSDNAYYVYENKENMKEKYNNIPFDNAKSIVRVITQGAEEK